VLFQMTENIAVRAEGGVNYQSCVKCSTELGPLSQNYKLHCVRRDTAVHDATPTAFKPERFVDSTPVFRQFFCPGCGALVENELAVEGDPVLRDICVQEPLARS
jgi:acetone carboxylase gamma subunit